MSVLLFVSGLAGVAIYYLRYCYHASLIGPVHHYAHHSPPLEQNQSRTKLYDGDTDMVETQRDLIRIRMLKSRLRTEQVR